MEISGKLKWYAQSFHFLEIMKHMRDTNYLTDVTFVCDDGREIKAHRIILVAHSPLFKQIFDSELDDDAIINIDDTNYEELKTILEFMYLGEAPLHPDISIDDIFSTSKALGFYEIINHSLKSGDHNCDVKISIGQVVSAEETKQAGDDFKPFKEEVENLLDSKVKLDGTTCPVCEKSFYKSRNMRQHYRLIHIGKPTECYVCYKMFSNRTKMTMHLNLIHKGNPKNCADCDKAFSNLTNLKTHRNTVHKGIKFSCDQCDYVTTQKGHLKEHVLSKHDGIVYTCDLCDQKYSQKGTLRIHRKKCTGKNSYYEDTLKMEDDKFDVTYKTKKPKMYRSKRIMMEKPILHPNVCPECGKSFGSSHGMTIHFESNHAGIRYPCSQCDKKFKQKSHLKTHIESVHELIKYDCDKCSYQASQRNHLKNHVKYKHQGIKFSCDNCNVHFSSKYDLKRHFKSKHESDPLELKKMLDVLK